MARLLAALMLIAFGGVACVSTATAPPQSIYVMRHLQKAAGEDPPLSAEGEDNARRLVAFFKSDPPAAIFVSNTRRARETGAPLARALQVAATTYEARDAAGLISAVAREKGTVLIIGHSNTVPDIIQRLGGAAPPPLADSDYGDIWKISGPDRKVIRLRLQAD
jgi:broad specificity phosphatase PhoE